METSGAGLSLTKRFELCRLAAYLDRSRSGVWTVGWGHTGPDVHEGLTISQGWADSLFKKDIQGSERGVTQLTDELTLTQGQFDALVDFVFNLGASRLSGSTLLMLLKIGDLAGAAAEFPKWDHEKENDVEIENAELLERRRAERLMFIGGRG